MKFKKVSEKTLKAYPEEKLEAWIDTVLEASLVVSRKLVDCGYGNVRHNEIVAMAQDFDLAREYADIWGQLSAAMNEKDRRYRHHGTMSPIRE